MLPGARGGTGSPVILSAATDAYRYPKHASLFQSSGRVLLIIKVTLFDEREVELTRITAHIAHSPGQMLIDWAARPDALFEYYFNAGSSGVTAVNGETKWSAVLGTRWQMGARRWFLRDVVRIEDRALPVRQERAPMSSPRDADRTRRSRTGRAATPLDATPALSHAAQRAST